MTALSDALRETADVADAGGKHHWAVLMRDAALSIDRLVMAAETLAVDLDSHPQGPFRMWRSTVEMLDAAARAKEQP